MSTNTKDASLAALDNPNYPRVPPPPDMRPEIVVHTQDDDERAWMQVAENAWVRPLLFNPMMGTWTDMMRAEGAQVLNRHHHANPVTVYTLEGAWGYLEHDWVATPGTFIVEPAGETHTLIVHPSAGHMKAIFHNWGPFLDVDAEGNVTAYSDVFSRLEMFREHYRQNGLGADFLDNLIR